MAPESIQRNAKCIIGRDYPLPIVNHASASQTNMKRMKQVYEQLSKYRTTLKNGQTEGKVIARNWSRLYLALLCSTT